MSTQLDIAGILERAGADADAPEGSQAWALAQVANAVSDLIQALETIQDFRGELNAPVANSVKLRGIARAALHRIGAQS